MPTQKVPIGSCRAADGVRVDRTHIVEFEGDKLAVREKLIDDTGTLGFAETLYYTDDRRLLVHVANWSTQHGEMIIYSMLEVTRQDLQEGGRFAELAMAAWAWLRK